VSSPQQRRKSRRRALEFLFSIEFTNYEWEEALEAFWETFETKQIVREYAKKLIKGVMKYLDTIDEHIDGALTNWTPDRVGKVERNILRVAVFEIAYTDDVPQKVAINEAIEIAKGYGTDESAGFVNAVLDKLKSTTFVDIP
jgi:N utilization substance protein B